MNAFNRIFGAVEPRFLARAYLIGVLFFASMVWMQLQAGHGLAKSASALAFLAISTVLFPFAKLVWNEARNFLMGDNIFFGNAFVVLLAKLFVNLLLWCFAIFIAPIGMAYLWYRTRAVSSGVA